MKNKKVALIGQPNVGKSTIFNALTGMHQHTGNWSGKTVENAYGECRFQDTLLTIYDLPGTYSLIHHSLEEKVASDFICFEKYDLAIVVCDAVCLERSLNLVLQTLEILPNVVVCVNLLDEAQKKGIYIDLKKLETILGVPVVGTSARSKEGLEELLNRVVHSSDSSYYRLTYPQYIENFITYLETKLPNSSYNSRWLCLKLLKDDTILGYLKELDTEEIKQALILPRKIYKEEDVVATILNHSKEISSEVVKYKDNNYQSKMYYWDKLLTNKLTGIPIMLLLLFGILWLTIRFSNIPSEYLFSFFGFLEKYLLQFLDFFLYLFGFVMF